MPEDDFNDSRRQREFEDRMERAFDPHTRHSLIDRGEISTGGNSGLDALMASLDALANDEDIPDADTGPIFTEEEFEAARAENPATPVIRAYTSRYGRQIKKRVALDAEIEKLDPNLPRYHEAMAELAEVKRRIKIELDRSTDDTYRERERADEYKLTIGKDERNTDRRKRPYANVMTAKAVLAAETPDEKKAREHKRRLELQNIRRAKAKAIGTST